MKTSRIQERCVYRFDRQVEQTLDLIDALHPAAKNVNRGRNRLLSTALSIAGIRQRVAVSASGLV